MAHLSEQNSYKSLIQHFRLSVAVATNQNENWNKKRLLDTPAE